MSLLNKSEETKKKLAALIDSPDWNKLIKRGGIDKKEGKLYLSQYSILIRLLFIILFRHMVGANGPHLSPTCRPFIHILGF